MISARRRWLVVGLSALALALFVVVALTQRTPVERLTQVYTPTFRHVPASPPIHRTVRVLWHDLQGPDGQTFLRHLLPSQGGVLWLSLLVTLVVAFDFDRLGNPRNLDLVLLQALALSMFEIMRFFRVLGDAVYVQLMDWVFIAIFALNALLIARALWRVAHPAGTPWRPAIRLKPLIAVALVMLACDTMIALVREPDDVGFFVNLGAQRLRERHEMPYGDPLLTGSPGAAYGPLLYVAHLPFQLALAPHPLNAESIDRPALGAAATYNLPPPLATKLCTIAFHLIGVFALFVAARRLAGRDAAWALVALYCGSAFVLGIGGEDYFIGGMTYISHIAPTATTLVAFALLPVPWLSGVALALAAGVGFYPAFMAPAWLGYYWTRASSRREFLLGFLPTCIAIGLAVLRMSRPAGGRGLVGTIVFDTFGHHTDPAHYGFSPFSFWGQRGGIRGWFNSPLVAHSSFTTPFLLVFVAFAAGSFWIARRRAPHHLALVASTIAIGSSLQKIHPTGTYVAWALPFLLIGLFADARAASLDEPAGSPGIDKSVPAAANA
jgi:hypothetical protein